jgi:hypothetical protein
VNPLDSVNKAKELFYDVMNNPESDDMPLEDTIIQPEELEPAPIKEM